MLEIDYTDQAIRSTKFYDRRITSAYTPYGISCIDLQYCHRIQNIHNKIILIESIMCERHNKYKNKNENDLPTIIPIKKYVLGDWAGCSGWGNDLRITWETGFKYDFHYWDETLKIDPKTHKECPKALLKDIRTNPHLHDDIKDNLIGNLMDYLKN
jgi:hypothetical protein